MAGGTPRCTDTILAHFADIQTFKCLLGGKNKDEKRRVTTKQRTTLILDLKVFRNVRAQVLAEEGSTHVELTAAPALAPSRDNEMRVGHEALLSDVRGDYTSTSHTSKTSVNPTKTLALMYIPPQKREEEERGGNFDIFHCVTRAKIH